MTAILMLVTWTALAPGVEHAAVRLDDKPSHGDGLLQVVRVDPKVATVELGLASQEGPNRSAAAWVDRKRWLAAINAGMYQNDHKANVGYCKHGPHMNNPRWNVYESVLALDPIEKGLPRAVILDRDAPDFAQQSAKYKSLVQNLRLIKGPGVNVWQPNSRRWSEAAVAMDKQGRILFLFTRTPYEMVDFNKRLLALPLEIVRAMHVEGGPEASLSVRGKGLKLDLAGSYETAFVENDGNGSQWDLPNVIGVR
jgi:hypothetical protein